MQYMKTLTAIKCFWFCLVAALLFLCGAASAETLCVKVREAKLRAQPEFWAAASAGLKYGDRLTELGEHGEWYKVKTSGGLEGYIHSSAVTDREVVLSGRRAGAADVDQGDVVMAGKGFSPEIERQYSAANRNLSYAEVDGMERIKVSDAELTGFIRQGQAKRRRAIDMFKEKTLIREMICALSLISFLASCGYENMGATMLNSVGVPVSGKDLKVAQTAGGQLYKAAKGLSEEQEYYLGRGVSATLLGKYRPLRDGQVNRYLNEVGLVLAGYSDRPETFGGYHFLALETDEVNAVSAPGGFVFVTKGFLRIIPDEDALAAVLAHEVAHVVKGHGTAAISQANLTSALTLIGRQAAESQGGEAGRLLTGTFGDSIKDITDTLLTKGYSRSQEYEADRYAVALMGKAGYDQQALLSMLQALEKMNNAKGAGGWFSTHPDPGDRQEEVAGKISAASASVSDGRKIRAARFAQFKIN
jgi:beta-barrel assembly-enhancing protease